MIIFHTALAPKVINNFCSWSSRFIINLAIFIKPLNVKRFRSKWQSSFSGWVNSVVQKFKSNLVLVLQVSQQWKRLVTWSFYPGSEWQSRLYCIFPHLCNFLLLCTFSHSQWIYWNASYSLMNPQRIAVFSRVNFGIELNGITFISKKIYQ